MLELATKICNLLVFGRADADKVCSSSLRARMTGLIGTSRETTASSNAVNARFITFEIYFEEDE